MKNILTIDVEDYFQVENFKKRVKFSDWDKYEMRVQANTEKILSILGGSNSKATFFVLGWVAEKLPHLVKKISDAGHEIASHGYGHDLIYERTPEEFKDDLLRSRTILEDIIKRRVSGYRAPSWSVTKKSLWAIDILMEERYSYDSSVFPIYSDHGGLASAKRFPHRIYNHKNSIWELPISTVKIFGLNVPFSGGGYFRLLPYRFIKRSIEKINREGNPVIIYLHPWEFDAEQPRIMSDPISGFRHYVNIEKTERKLHMLLEGFDFIKIDDFLTDRKEHSHEVVGQV